MRIKATYRSAATLAGREIHLRTLPTVFGTGRLIRNKKVQKESTSAAFVRKSRVAEARRAADPPPWTEKDPSALLGGSRSAHPLSLCDPDRCSSSVRLRHHGGKETALTPLLSPSAVVAVCSVQNTSTVKSRRMQSPLHNICDLLDRYRMHLQ